MFRSALNKGGADVRSASILVSYKNAIKMKDEFVRLKGLSDKLTKELEGAGYSGDQLQLKACGNSIACEIKFIDFQTLIRAKGTTVSCNFTDGSGVVVCCRDTEQNESAIKLGTKAELLGKGTEETDNGVKKFAAIVKEEKLDKYN
jgi:hypothetical protein